MTEKMPFFVKPANLMDLNALRKLEVECFDQDAWPLWDLVGVLSFPGIIRLKAVAGDEMAGFIAADLHEEENRGWILTLGVFVRYRRMGVARALLQECEKKIEMPAIRLTVRVGNDSAIRLYMSEGYSMVEEWKNYYARGENGFVFEKKLLKP
jgi:ribosomal-protein-alanine N-acetyltransferase